MTLNWALCRRDLFSDGRVLWDPQFKSNGEHENFFLQLKKYSPYRVVYYPGMQCDHHHIGNAGYGEGREGDVCDVHRYWGWYYNSFLTYYNLRDSVTLFGKPTDSQPLTFSECVGSYTSPLGSFNAILSKQLAPQLGWTGHSGNQRKDALEYQAFMTKRQCEEPLCLARLWLLLT